MNYTKADAERMCEYVAEHTGWDVRMGKGERRGYDWGWPLFINGNPAAMSPRIGWRHGFEGEIEGWGTAATIVGFLTCMVWIDLEVVADIMRDDWQPEYSPYVRVPSGDPA